MFKEIRDNPRAFTYAVLMHLLLLAALIISVNWKAHTVSDAGSGVPIKAQVVDNARVQAEVAKLKAEQEQKQREEEQRKEKLERAAQQAEQQRVQEEQRLKDLQQKQVQEQQRLKELEQQRIVQQKAEQQRQAKLKKQQAEAEQQAKQKREQEAKAKQQRLAEEKKQQAAAAEKKRQAAAAEAKRRAEAEKALQEQLAAEESAMQGSRNQSLIDQYVAGIKQAVENSWLRPPSARTGMSCVVLVNLIPGGDVAGVRIIESSGDAAFDRSVENAVRKAAPLPLPPDPSLFDNFRELRFEFKPES